jgi:cytochrome c oxidase assembly protein Cox11
MLKLFIKNNQVASDLLRHRTYIWLVIYSTVGLYSIVCMNTGFLTVAHQINNIYVLYSIYI